jgi:AraC-like DNA-binding protein
VDWLDALALSLIGFSIVSCLLLLAAQFTVYAKVEMSALARSAGVILLLGLAALQGWHALWLVQVEPIMLQPAYLVALYLVAPAFYLFFRGALQPRSDAWVAALLLYSPALVAWSIPASIGLPLAFALGTLYALLLTRLALRLRGQRKRFRLEALAFAAHGLVAILILVLGLATPWLGIEIYVHGYAILIGLGLLAALYTLLRIPDLATRAAEAVRSAYSSSSLKSVDVDAAVARLERLMRHEQIYVNDSLSLSSLAQALELSPHQLSELVNTHFGIGFSRYVREHRVRAAQRMLIDEPQASVLSVGLAVGFTSQSNFYAAFREITGLVPGRFRRQHSPSPE